MQGSLRLKFERDGARTRLAERAHTPPLQVIRTFELPDGAALLHLHNTSGGVLSGDCLETAVEIGPRAEVQLTTTGATRLYRGRETALQTMTVAVGAGGLLEYLPDPMIPFAGSHFRQETRIELAEDAGLFWWETLTPGRTARGEVFAWEHWESRFDLSVQGFPIAQERISLEPSRQALDSLAYFGPYRYLSTMYLCRAGRQPAEWQALEAGLSQTANDLTRHGEVVWGVSTLPGHGLSVRGISVSGRELASGLVTFWRAAKRELYGRDIILPRKVY